MKNVVDDFKDYYPLSLEEKLRVFGDQKTYFIFDTNALLDVYRVGRSLSEKVMKVLKRYEKRIVIPFHVAEEYHKHMLPIIIAYCNKYDDVAHKLTMDDLLKGVIKDFELNDYPVIKDALKRNIGNVLKRFVSEMKNERNYLQDQISSWELQNSISAFLDGKILEGLSEDELKNIYETEGQTRYNEKTPPGYKDNGNTENPYGDLIIWKEILKFAKEHQKASIIFVSRDLKEDWISIIHGKKCGPRIELLKEFHKENPNTLLFYSLSEFIKYANTGSNILDDKDIQSVTDYTATTEGNEVKNQSIITQRPNYTEILSDQEVQNLLLLSLLRRRYEKNQDVSSLITQEQPQRNEVPKDNSDDSEDEL